MDGSATLDLVIAGYIVGIPLLAFALIDFWRIPPHVYRYTTYSRGLWTGAFLIGYAACGVGVIVALFFWLRSAQRAELRADWADERRWEPCATPEPATPAPAIPATPSPPRPDMTRPPELQPVIRHTRIARRKERRRRRRWALIAVATPLLVTFGVFASGAHVR